MSEGIPNSARDVLARQTPADAHPTPDLLNGYMEQALSEAEKQQVTLHLASCAECREVLFLAGAAVEELEPAPVMMSSTADHMAAAVPAPRAERPEGCAVLQPRSKPPKQWWKWALPLTAVLVVGAAALIERDQLTSMFSPPSTRMAAMKQEPATSSRAARGDAPVNPAVAASNESSQRRAVVVSPAVPSESFPKVANRIDAGRQPQMAKAGTPANAPQSSNAKMADNVTAGAAAGGASASSSANAAAAPAAAKATSPAQPASPSQSVEVTSAAPLVSGGNDLAAASPELKTEAMAKSLTGAGLGITALGPGHGGGSASTRWRISRDGHVEHTVGTSTWERVMAAEPVTFHVVATVGKRVWAGGSDGALFRSNDGGKHWERVALADEHGTITTIHFDTAQQGSLTSDSGATWTTPDGGRTWSKQ